MSYFLHCYRAPDTTPEGIIIPESISCIEIISWEVREHGIMCVTSVKYGKEFKVWEAFRHGNKFYIVENHGQCWEPNGDIFWKWGGRFDEQKAAA